jgi:hypothetical protein
VKAEALSAGAQQSLCGPDRVGRAVPVDPGTATASQQGRRGPLATPALPGQGVARAPARSIARTRRAATELAAHRRRLLECAIEPDLDPTDALLLRVEPASASSRLAERAGEGADHRAGLARLLAAASAVAEGSHRIQLKAEAASSRPPAAAKGHNGIQSTDGIHRTPGTDGIHGRAGSPPNAAQAPSDLRLSPPPGRIAAREGLGVDNSIPGTPGTDGPAGPASRPLSAARAPSGLRLTDLDPPGRIAGREGLGVDNGIEGIHGSDGTDAPASHSLSAAQGPSNLRLTASSPGRIAGREGEVATTSTPTTTKETR